MVKKESERYEIIQKLINGKINGTQASKILSLTVRHVRRLKKNVKKNGIKGIIHKNRGKPSNRKLSDERINEIEKIVKKSYPDFKPKFASEKLEENHKIKISSEKLRQLMIKWSLWKPKSRKRNREYRTWRPRKDSFGEMQQFDGCYHFWFEDRGEEACLLASIDDATGKVFLKFDKNESTLAVFDFWQDYFKKIGLPISIYLDKFSTYKINHKNAVDNSTLMTQFQRAMSQLDVKPITAHSPQAKGRVERLFETLQDRLVKELRLNSISTIAEANQFLEEKYIDKFNGQFAVKSAANENLHRPINQKTDLNAILSIQNQRVVQNDFTISFKNTFYQLEEIQPTTVYKKDKVLIEERMDNSVKIKLRDNYLKYKILPERPEKVINLKLPAITTTKTVWTPPINHPWRKPMITRRVVAN